MGTSITASNMTIKIVEDVTFNGVQQGTTNTVSFTDIAEFSRRIVTVPTSEVSLATFGAAVGIDAFINTNIRYIRITNLDDTNYVTLNFEGAGSTDYSVRLDKNMGTYVIMATHASLGVDDHCDINGVSLEALQTIKAIANSGSCDLELVIASK